MTMRRTNGSRPPPGTVASVLWPRTHRARLSISFATLLIASCRLGDADGTLGAPSTVAERPPCEATTDCSVVSQTEAGRDAAGVLLRVQETTRGRRDIETGEPSSAPGFGACELREFWLERAGEFSLALALCNDGYGASGVGEDVVSIAPNRLVHTQSGGSAWRWTTHQSYALSPRRLLTESTDGYWAVARNAEHRVFDLEAFAGSVAWYAPGCDEEGVDIDEGSIG